MPDFLEKQRRDIEARLRALQPYVDEYNQLEAASSALAGVGRDGGSAAGTARTRRTRATGGRGRTTTRRARTTTRTGSASRTGSATRTRARAGAPTRRRRGRPRGSGTRAVQALELVKANPGITIPELAKRMGIKQNYLYRVLPGLQSDGKVRKQGRGWVPKG